MCNKFKPNNNIDFLYFVNKFCYNCRSEKFYHTKTKGDRECDILKNMINKDVKDIDYPEELTFNEDLTPICSMFKKHDWMEDLKNDNDIKEDLDFIDPDQLELF